MVAFLTLITPFVALAASLTVILAIRFLDVVEREPKRLIAFGLLLGAASTVPSIIWQLIGESIWQSFGASEATVSVLTTVVDAPISEELFKGLALLVLILTQRTKLDSLTDYLIYACAVGIGFELVENILYQWAASQQGNQIETWFEELNNRTLASAGGHAFFSIWLGLAGWIIFQSRSNKIKLLAPACLILSIILHGLNNLTAVMSGIGPSDVILPINRLGTTLAVINSHLALALFIGLIGIAILRDVQFLFDYGSLIQSRIMRTEPPHSPSLSILKELTSPINHVMANSSWSWKRWDLSTRAVKERSSYRTFARLALAAAQRGPADSMEDIARAGFIEEGVRLVQCLS